MSYKKKTYQFENAIEVEEYHTARYGAPGMKRAEKKKLTPDQMARINQWQKEKKARRKLRAHFKVRDYFTTLTYRRDCRPPDMAAAKKDFQVFLRKVRREYRKRGAELLWMRNIECGTKGAWHVHLIVNRISDTDIILREAWKHGRVVSELLYAKGEFKELAAYITKTPRTDKRLREADYSCSRNLPIPEPVEKIYNRWKTFVKIREPKGFYLDEDSICEGINPITGFPYRHYTFLRVRRE